MLFPSRSKTRKHGVLLDRPADDVECCKSCDGACCRSFPSVDITWAEYEQLRDLGATRLFFSLTGHHQMLIENGCEFLADGQCSIYPHRPDICRRFICRDE